MVYCNVELSKFIGAEIEIREVNGELTECISIPIKTNGMRIGKNKKVFFPFLLKEKKPNLYNQTHYISLYNKDREFRKRISELGYEENLKFLGYAKSVFYKKRDYRKAVPLEEAISQ